MKWTSSIVVSVLLVSAAVAQDRPISQPYVQDVLQARLVAVVPYSASGPLLDPTESQRVRLDVQNAMMKWGRYQLTNDTNQADLIIAVRKGRAQTATVGSGRTDNPGVILYPNDTGVSISVGSRPNGPLSRSDPPQDSGPRLGTQVGSSEDILEVYLGRNPRVGDASRKTTEYPLDEPPIWSYRAKDALKAPKVAAIAKFRQAVEAAAKKKP